MKNNKSKSKSLAKFIFTMFCLFVFATSVLALTNNGEDSYLGDRVITNQKLQSTEAIYALAQKYGKAVLVVAARDGDLNLANQLLGLGASVNVCDVYKETPLHNACRNGQLEMVQLLLKNGAEVNVPNSKGWTPLHLAAGRGYLDIAKMLLDKGAHVIVKDGGGYTPIYYAGIKGHKDMVSLLLDYVIVD